MSVQALIEKLREDWSEMRCVDLSRPVDPMKVAGMVRSGDALLAALEFQARQIENLRSALEPFATLGLPFTKADENDDSVWARTPDETPIMVGRAGGVWQVTVGELRRASSVLQQGEGG